MTKAVVAMASSTEHADRILGELLGLRIVGPAKVKSKRATKKKRR